MKQEIIVEQKKKVYISPAISTVRLVAGEAVLSTCKTNNGPSVQATACPGDISCGPFEAAS